MEEGADEDTCAICLEALDERAVQLAGCRHSFHAPCVLDFVRASGDGRCPMCRCNPFVGDEEPAAGDDEEHAAASRVTMELMQRLRQHQQTEFGRALRAKTSAYNRRCRALQAKAATVRLRRQALNNEEREYRRSREYATLLDRKRSLETEMRDTERLVRRARDKFARARVALRRQLCRTQNTQIVLGGRARPSYRYEVAESGWSQPVAPQMLAALDHAGNIDDDTLVDHPSFDAPKPYRVLRPLVRLGLV